MNKIFRRKEKRCVLILFVLRIKISNQNFVTVT